MSTNGDSIMASEAVLVPPSPGVLNGFFDGGSAQTATTVPNLPIRSPKTPTKPKEPVKPNDRTGAGVKKNSPKSKAAIQKLVDALTASAATGEQAAEQPFRFMDLPGEIRNLVYRRTHDNPRQALLVHRPRYASLRSRTRMDRARMLPSDVVDKELNDELNNKKTSHRRVRGRSKSIVPRDTNRPFWGLTQVCRQVRTEFRPIYLAKQEIGMDLTEVVQYVQTFYFDAPTEFAKLDMSGQRTADMPLNGNLTIAVGDKPNDIECSKDGVEVIPLLDLWANSFKIEAGFGRYLKPAYVPQADGEAKDLYRLFGRRVMKNRQCSGMNHLWRTILRTRSLASVTLHRKPASQIMDVASLVAAGVPVNTVPPNLARPLPVGSVAVEPKPYIHILFRAECAEPWMTQLESEIPKDPDWLLQRGFAGMEHFDVKVGVAPPGFDRRV